MASSRSTPHSHLAFQNETVEAVSVSSVTAVMRSIVLLTVLSIKVFAAEEIPFLQSEYDPSKWPVAHLVLSQAGTLKDVFDSGLRPYRFPGCETSTLEVKHLRLNIQLSSGKRLPEIQMEWMNIAMFDDGELAHIEGATPQMSLEKSRAEMLKWLSYGSRSSEELDNYLKAVKADPLDFDDPYRGLPDGCAVRWKEPKWKEQGGGPQCTVWFRKTFSDAEPLKLYFKLSWGLNRKVKDAKSYRIPIPPPPEYEHVSMEAPDNFGPDSGADFMRSKGIYIGDRKGGVTKEEDLKQQATLKEREDKKTTGTQSAEPAAKATNQWLWLLLVPFLVLIWRFKMKLSKR